MDNMFQKEELILTIRKFIDKNKHRGEMTAFYLFGSYANGMQTTLSDVDLAVLLDKAVGPEQYLAARLRLMGELSVILGTDMLELVVLNEVPPNLAYRVIRDGELIYMRDEAAGQLIDFKVRTMDRYFDFLPVQRLFSEGLARRTRDGVFGGR